MEDYRKLLEVLEQRFHAHPLRHKGLEWEPIKERLETDSAKLRTLDIMEATGGEPDVVGYDQTAARYIFCDCSQESPLGRRNLCYDHAALESRKKNKPRSSALDEAAAIGIDLLTEEQYRKLQELGDFDTKTSSWIVTPDNIRALGGALFCDRRYNHVFTYHNGAESYYAARGFRGALFV